MEDYKDLCAIVEAVEGREAAKVHLLVQNHVYRFNRLMEENERLNGFPSPNDSSKDRKEP